MSLGGAVYDRGYRPYDGPRGGRRASVLALYKASVRRAIGLRRSWRQKFLPLGLLALVSIPAAVNVGIGYATRNSPLEDFSIITYRDYVGVSSMLLLFVAVCAPDVLCPDRRQRVLPVIFARPLTGTDYVLAKFAAIASLVFAFSFLPQVLLFVGQTLVSKDGSLNYMTDHADVLWKVPVAVAALAAYYAALSLAVSSLTARRVVAGASVFGLTIISSIVAGDPARSRRPRWAGHAVQPPRPAAARAGPRVPRPHPRGRRAVGRARRRCRGPGGLRRRPRRLDRRPPVALPVGRTVTATPPVMPNQMLDPAFVANPTVAVSNLSVFFGPKVALSELSCSFGPGVTGLLGPNGAGKTTLMRAVTGLQSVSSGQVWVAGGDPRSDRAVQGHIGLVPEDEAVPGGLTPRELARYRAALHSVADREAPDRWLGVVELLDVADRPMDGFSKGMRQRAKVAAALVSNPTVLILDEPLNGADPVQRGNLIRLFRLLGDQGRTVLVSSHVLSEVERLAERVVVLVRGRLAAAGSRRAIRDAMADRPRRVLVRADPPRVLAAVLAGHEAVGGLEVDGDRLTVATSRAGDLALALPALARGAGVRLWEVRPLDESLEALFRELVR